MVMHYLMADIVQQAKILFASGLFPLISSEAQAAAIIMAGAEMGLGAVESLREIQIVKGKLAFSSALISARIKASGKYNFSVIENGDNACVLRFFEEGEIVGESSFSLEDAKKAGLLSNPVWSKFPRNMLFARALTNGARWYCSEVFSGSVYTPDELRDEEASEGQAPKKKAVTHYDGKLSNGKDPQAYTPEQIKHLLTTASIRVKLTSRDIELLESRLASEGNDEQRHSDLEVQDRGHVLPGSGELETNQDRGEILRPADSPDPRASGSDVGAEKILKPAGSSDSAGDASSSTAVGGNGTGPGRSKKRHGEYPSVR